MPRIPDRVIQSVFFLYKSREDAEAGKDPGGTGFVLGAGLTHLSVSDGPAFYGVTNWHVACQSGYSVIRLNTADGGADIREYGPEDWHFIPRGPDVAVVPLELESRYPNVAPHVHVAQCVPKGGWSIGRDDNPSVGDDVFMLGLFVDHKGLTTNVPSARFGNVSMLPSPSAPIEQLTGYMGESYVVDMHSRTGFSGSPVFLFRTFGSDLTTSSHKIARLTVDDRSYARGSIEHFDVTNARAELRTLFYFLGIHWGQFPERWDLREGPLEENRPIAITDGSYVRGFSGMTLVVPAWDIVEVLNLPKLQKMRESKKQSMAKRVRPIAETVKPAAASASDENPAHREDFTHLLNEAARRREQED